MTEQHARDAEWRGSGPSPRACPAERPSLLLPARLRSLLRSRGLREGAVALVDQAIASLTTFLTGVLVARGCASDQAQFGHYVFGMTIVITILGFQRGLISLPYTVLSPRLDRASRAVYLGSIVAHQIVACALVFAGFAAVARILTMTGIWSGQLAAWPALAAAVVGRLMLDFVRTILLAELRFRLSLIVGLVSSTVTLAWLGWDLAGDRISTSRTFLVCGAFWAAPAVVTLLMNRRHIHLRLGQIGEDFIRSFRIGKWMAATDAAFMLARQMIPWVLVATWGSAELAILGVCEGVAGLIGYASRGLSAFFLPKLSHAANAPDRLKGIVVCSSVMLVPLAAVSVLAAWLLGDRLVSLLYSSTYRGLTGLILIHCVSSSLGLISVPVNQALHALRRSDLGFKALVCSFPLSLLLGGVLTCRLGVWGASISTLLGVAGAFAHRAFFLARHLARQNRPEMPVAEQTVGSLSLYSAVSRAGGAP